MASKLCSRRSPRANVEWTKIPPGSEVALCGQPGTRYYVVKMPGGKKAVPFWGSQDARQAQQSLDAWARRGRR